MNPASPSADANTNFSSPYTQLAADSEQHDYAAATAAAALSHHNTSAPIDQVSAGVNGRKRKSTSVPGSRGVANLTPEQLAKKRANDREAQRAIRERTRNTIESLERRIKELEGQQPFQELQRVVQERDRALQECEELRRRLATVASVVGGQAQQQQPPAQPNLHELAALTAQQSPLPPLNSTVSQTQTYSPTHPEDPQPPAPPPPNYEQQQNHIHPDLRDSNSQQSPVSQVVGARATDNDDAVASVRGWSPRSHQQISPNDMPVDDRLRAALQPLVEA